MRFGKVTIFLVVLLKMCPSSLFGQTIMDEKEMLRHLESVLKSASEDYLNPGPELYGKYRVCKNYQVIAVFETKAEALSYAENHAPGSVEIRRDVPSEHGLSTSITIPGAIQKIAD